MLFFKKSTKIKNYETFLSECLQEVHHKFFDELSSKNYFWDRSYGVRQFESFIISKFIIDYSLKLQFESNSKPEELENFYIVFNDIFIKEYNKLFESIGMSYGEMETLINEKIENYKQLRSEYKPPTCWHSIYSIVTHNKTIEETVDELNKQKKGFSLIKSNPKLKHMVQKYENVINNFTKKNDAFITVEIFFPKMIRFSKEKLKLMKLKNLSKLAKKIEKTSEKK